MMWIAFGAATLAAASSGQTGDAPANGHFTVAELRPMCRGESDANAQFRTRAAYELMAELQRSKCRMYLLGVADGIGWRQADGGGCAPAANERDALAGRLVEAVLLPSPGRDPGIREIVAATLIAHPPCR